MVLCSLGLQTPSLRDGFGRAGSRQWAGSPPRAKGGQEEVACAKVSGEQSAPCPLLLGDLHMSLNAKNGDLLAELPFPLPLSPPITCLLGEVLIISHYSFSL